MRVQKAGSRISLLPLVVFLALAAFILLPFLQSFILSSYMGSYVDL